jgi:hypothetical protein
VYQGAGVLANLHTLSILTPPNQLAAAASTFAAASVSAAVPLVNLRYCKFELNSLATL